MTVQELPQVPLPAEAIDAALKAFLAKKIELRSDDDGPLEHGRNEAVAVLAAVAAAAPLIREQETRGDAREPVAAPDAVVRAAAAAAYESVRTIMGFPTDFEGAPEPLQARYMDMQRAALAAAVTVTPSLSEWSAASG